MKIFNASKIKYRQLVSKKTGEEYSLSAVLTDLVKFKDIFIHQEILKPGKRASLPHIHTSREEMIYVLSGHPTLRYGDQLFSLGPGDFMGFEPNKNPSHVILNNSKENVQLLVMTSNPKNDEVVFS